MNYFEVGFPGCFSISRSVMEEDKSEMLSLSEELAVAIGAQPVRWRKYAGLGLDVDYTCLLPRPVADQIFRALEKSIQYLPPEKSRVCVFGKWHQIPRQQAAYGDSGLTYTYSGVRVNAAEWPRVLLPVRSLLEKLIGVHFNFVLINKYRSGDDYIGEHRDDEAELVPSAPIASLSLGTTRTFVLRHADNRSGRKRDADGKSAAKIEPVRLDLEHGSLLLMNAPTNRFWYHSVPRRKEKPGIRINLTFRQIDPKLAAAAASKTRQK